MSPRTYIKVMYNDAAEDQSKESTLVYCILHKKYESKYMKHHSVYVNHY